MSRKRFKKSRLVPLHEAVVEALDSYLKCRRRRVTADPFIFISHRGGRRLGYNIVAATFQKVLDAAAIPGQLRRSMPRLHDLRHRFAVKALQACPDNRDHITRHMLALSTYLGHARAESTYWYLESTLALMTDIAEACESFLTGGAS
jgi:integrase/recombinase XerD